MLLDSPSGWKLYRSLLLRDMSNSGFVRVKDTPLLPWSSCVSMLSWVQSALHFLSRTLITHSDDVGKTPNCPDCDRVPRPLGRTAWTEEGEGSAAVLSLMWSKIQQQSRRRSKFSKLQDECSRSVGLSCLRCKSHSVSLAQ